MNWVEKLAESFPVIRLQGIYEMKNYHIELVDGKHDILFNFTSNEGENVEVTSLTVISETDILSPNIKQYDYLCKKLEQKIFLN